MKLRKVKIIHIRNDGLFYWINANWDTKTYPNKWFKAYYNENEQPNLNKVLMLNSDLVEIIEWTNIYYETTYLKRLFYRK